MMVPHDNFTPHGYLDNPYHCWKLNPSGVLRSLAPLGMGWHMPNLGSYVRNQFQYTAHLTLGLRIGKTVLVTPEDSSAWARGKAVASPTITQSQQDTGWQVRSVILPCKVTLGGEPGQSERKINVVLARGVSQEQSYQHWEDGIEEIERAEAEHR